MDVVFTHDSKVGDPGGVAGHRDLELVGHPAEGGPDNLAAAETGLVQTAGPYQGMRHQRSSGSLSPGVEASANLQMTIHNNN